MATVLTKTQAPPGFAIAIDPGARLVDISLDGHWTTDTVSRFAAEVTRAFGTMARRGRAPGEFVTLLDGTRYEIQTKETIAAFAGLLANPAFASRKVAMVLQSALARIQASRIANLPHHRHFTSRTEAMAWLME